MLLLSEKSEASAVSAGAVSVSCVLCHMLASRIHIAVGTECPHLSCSVILHVSSVAEILDFTPNQLSKLKR